MNKYLFNMLQWTWGILQSFSGLVIYFILRKNQHFIYHGALVTIWNKKGSVSLGKFIFLTDDPLFCYPLLKNEGKREIIEMLLVHEYGHSVQSMILGPLYFLIVGIPSFLWNILPVCRRLRNMGINYYDFYCERNADFLGEWLLKNKSIGRIRM